MDAMKEMHRQAEIASQAFKRSDCPGDIRDGQQALETAKACAAMAQAEASQAQADALRVQNDLLVHIIKTLENIDYSINTKVFGV